MNNNILNHFYSVPRAGMLRCSDGGGPFGFDIQVAEVFDSIYRAYTPDAIVETGCFLGDTTEYLARQYSEVGILSCDIKREYADFAKERLKAEEHVSIQNVSGDVLVKESQEEYARPLYFLDAHWYSEWPLKAELACMRQGIALIHDFDISHSRFSYDTYAGQVCGPEVIKETVSENSYWVIDIEAASVNPVLQVGRRTGVAVAAIGAVAQGALRKCRGLIEIPNDGRPLSNHVSWIAAES